jgi:hypothetical protein
MLDVHPPEHTPHSWRDFFIHIATIVVGLCIAVGLEQSVEAIHHRQQRHHLEAALNDDTLKQWDDGTRCEKAMNDEAALLTARILQVRTALATHQPLSSEASLPFADCDLLSNSASISARSSGLLTVLSEQEIRVYAEADLIVDTFNNVGILPWISADYKLQGFELPFRVPATSQGKLDLSTATPAELAIYAERLGAVLAATIATRDDAQYARGATRALLDGERDPTQIQKDERRYVVPLGVPPRP